jgi:hypothetical protein
VRASNFGATRQYADFDAPDPAASEGDEVSLCLLNVTKNSLGVPD